jgi:hypothetical protein
VNHEKCPRRVPGALLYQTNLAAPLGSSLPSAVYDETVDDGDACEHVGQRPNGVVRHPPDGADGQHCSSKHSDPPAHLRSRHDHDPAIGGSRD